MARLARAATKLTQTLEPSPILQLLIRGRLGKYLEWGSSPPQGPVVLRGRKGGGKRMNYRGIARDKSCSSR
jgi:hypothetical protein